MAKNNDLLGLQTIHIIRNFISRHKIPSNAHKLLDDNYIFVIMPYFCPYCLRNTFASERALTQHQQRDVSCFKQMQQASGVESGYSTAHEFMYNAAQNNNQNRMNVSEHSQKNRGKLSQAMAFDQQDMLQLGGYKTAREEYSDDDMVLMEDDDNNEEGNDSGEDESNGSNEMNAEAVVDESIRETFKEYCQIAKDFKPFTDEKMEALKLMRILRQTKASLDTYEAIMEWHLKAKGDIHQHESLGSTSAASLGREILFDELRIRYNMKASKRNNDAPKFNNVAKVVVPASKAKVNVLWNDAKCVLQSLLTDPRILASDYCFHANDPFAPPPEYNYIGDLNTGRAYYETYKKLCTKPNQVLLPIIFYMDGANTGQFADLPVTQVKMSLGIFTRKARQKYHMWKILGYVPQISRPKSRGKRMLAASYHLDSARADYELAQNEGIVGTKTVDEAQDEHTVFAKIWESFVEIQEKGFKWDLHYDGKLYKDIEFVLFTPFFRCDTKEADMLCGKFGSRSGKVANLCRYCDTPTAKSDDPHWNKWKPKTTKRIQRLIDKEDIEGLRKLSQKCIDNATYRLRFGQHNERGIHWATPLEMLHAILLGIFKYMRDVIFEQIGPDSQQAPEFDALASQLGEILSRQSNRNKPKTKFSGGIKRGKLMAKEFTGILVCMLLACSSGLGCKILGKVQKKRFTDVRIRDWILLLETLLQWEEWLKSDTMPKHLVHRAQKKHRYIMWLIKKVGKRVKGMGLKLTKFHCILHMADDILNFGVPAEVNTDYNETHHKPTKRSALLTQRTRETFEEQTAKRVEELDLLELAYQEIDGRPIWNYYQGHPDPPQKPPTVFPEPSIGGAAYRCFERDGENFCTQIVRSKKKTQPDFLMEKGLINFVVDLQNAVSAYISEVPLFSVHQRNGEIFRANALYKGSVWRDWVMVDWDDYGLLPNKIWAFIDLTALPLHSGVNFGGLVDLAPGLYAIVESAAYVDGGTELVDKIETDCVLDADGNVEEYIFYLADVEAIAAPCMVVPNIGGPENGYLMLRDRNEWCGLFEQWLESPHHEDVMEDTSDEESSEEEVEEDDEEDDGTNEGDSEEEDGDNSQDEEESSDDEGQSSQDEDDASSEKESSDNESD